MAPVVQPGEGVADRECPDLGQQVGVGQRERSLGPEERQHLALEIGEARIVDGHPGLRDGAENDTVVDERHCDAGHRIRGDQALDRLRVGPPVEPGEHQRPTRDRPPGDAVVRADHGTHRGRVDLRSMNRPEEIAPGVLVQDRQTQGVGRNDGGDRLEQSRHEALFVEDRVRGPGEPVDRGEQTSPVGEQQLLPPDHQGDGQPLADRPGEAEVHERQRSGGRGPDRQHAQGHALRQQRHGDLGSDVGMALDIVGVGVDVFHEGGLAGAQDPTDDARIGIEHLRQRLVADVRPEAQAQPVGEQEGEIGIAHALGEHLQHGAQGVGGRAGGGEERADLLDAAERLVASALVRDVEAGAHDVGQGALIVEEAAVQP